MLNEPPLFAYNLQLIRK